MRSTRLLLAAVLILVQPVAARAQADSPPRVAEQEKSHSHDAGPEQREQQFAELLTGAALVGNFTVDGQRADKPLKPERYEISKARKIEGDTWEITARIKYGEVNVEVPIQLDVLWAGDTPVMSLTDLRIPLMEGSFTSRVLFYGDRYVGTWQHGKVGGHMFGHVERAGEEKPAGGNGAARGNVSGRVVLNGQPVEGAVVEFVPAGQPDRSSRGKTNAAGEFSLKLPPGEFEVRIKKSEGNRSRIPERYSEKSPLKADVQDGSNEFNFDLRTE